MRRGFSLLEVLFSVAFLIMVGLGIIALNVSSLRLVVDSETKTVAYALNDETIAHLRLMIERLDLEGLGGFRDTTSICTPDTGGCYLSCPEQLDASCSLQETPAPIQLGRSRLTFIRHVKVSEIQPSGSGKFLVQTATSWGTGISRSIQANYFLEKL